MHAGKDGSTGKRARKQILQSADQRLQNLGELQTLGAISDKVLAKIVERARSMDWNDDRCSEITLRMDLVRMRKKIFAEVRTSMTVRLTSGKDLEIEFADPCLLVSKLVGSSRFLQRAFSQALVRSPSSPDRPWSMVVSFDEYAPGNALAHDNQRKCMNFNVSFKELGPYCMATDDAWHLRVFWVLCVQAHCGPRTLYRMLPDCAEQRTHAPAPENVQIYAAFNPKCSRDDCRRRL